MTIFKTFDYHSSLFLIHLHMSTVLSEGECKSPPERRQIMLNLRLSNRSSNKIMIAVSCVEIYEND